MDNFGCVSDIKQHEVKTHLAQAASCDAAVTSSSSQQNSGSHELVERVVNSNHQLASSDATYLQPTAAVLVGNTTTATVSLPDTKLQTTIATLLLLSSSLPPSRWHFLVTLGELGWWTKGQ
jgi:hypothetical protein